ncbi:MAG: FG-GAP-like repeat-containing protein, partial [Planctomycetaceae bacterium]
MPFSAWLPALLRTNKSSSTRLRKSRRHDTQGWSRFDLLEDRTLLAAPQLDLALTIGGIDRDSSEGIEVDAAGNMYAIGNYSETVDLDPGTGQMELTSVGNTDIYISKMDSEGNLSWVASIGSTSEETAYGLTLDAEGNIFATGYIRGTVDFDPGSGVVQGSPTGGKNMFILKLDNDGNFEWVKQFGGRYEDVEVDSSGNVYIAGLLSSTIDFDPDNPGGELTSVWGTDAFVAKYDTDGNYIWAKSMGGGSFDEANAVSIDDQGNVLVTGIFQGTVDFDPGAAEFNLTSGGARDVFVTKLDSSGNFIWAKSFAGQGDDYARDVIVNSTGDVYLTGNFREDIDLDPGSGSATFIADGFWDLFLIKLDGAGDFEWGHGLGGSSSDFGTRLALDAYDNVYLAGEFSSITDFDPGPGTYQLADYGEFVSRWSESGEIVWAIKAYATTSAGITDITVDHLGQVYYSGDFQGTIDVDPGEGSHTITSVGSMDAVIVRLSQEGPPVADAGGPYEIPLGAQLQLDASGTVDLDQDPATLLYEWDLDGDGLFGETGAAAENGDEVGIDPLFKTDGFTNSAVQAISLKVTDADQQVDFAETIVTVLNVIPKLDWAVSFGGLGIDEAKFVDLDPAGNIYVAGEFFESFDADPGPNEWLLPHSGGRDIFVSKYDPAGNLLWAKSIGNAGYEDVEGFVVNNQGHVHLVGYFEDTLDFDPGTGIQNRTSAGEDDLFVLKLDSDGNLLWVNTIGGIDSDYADSVAIDQNNRVIVAATLSATVDVNPGPAEDIRTIEDHNAFVLAFDSNGQFAWATEFTAATAGNGASSDTFAVATDASGNVYAAGLFTSEVDFDPGVNTTLLNSTAGRDDLFVAKLTEQGDLVWAKAMFSSDNTSVQIPYDIEVDENADLYVTGRFSGTTDFDPGPGVFNLTSVGARDVFVLKLDSDGVLDWADSFGSSENDQGVDLEVGPEGTVYVAGNVGGTTDFDSGPGSYTPAESEGFLVYYNADGSLAWVTTGRYRSNGLALDSTGNIYQVGAYDGTVDLAPGNEVAEFTSSGDKDAFLRKLGKFIEPDLSITKSSPVVAVEQGAEHSYTVTVTYSGSESANDIRVQDDPSTFLENIVWSAEVFGTGSLTTSGSGPLDEVIELSSDSYVVYTITGIVKETVRGSITNVATVSSNTLIESNLSNNRNADTDIVIPAATAGSGTFTNSTRYQSTPALHPLDFELADFDGDGDLDAFIVNQDFDDVGLGSQLWWNDGNGIFTKSEQEYGDSFVYGVSAGDIDGDGDIDLFLIDTFTELNNVLLNDGNGNFTESRPGIAGIDSELVDLNGDGILDLIVLGGGAKFYLNDGAGNFNLIDGTSISGAEGISYGDVDNDGDIDVVVAARDRFFSVMTNDGTGKFTRTDFSSDRPEYDNGFDIALGDLDGDGDLDVVRVAFDIDYG